LFVYSDIEFHLDLNDPDGFALPLGLFAEWNDGRFWKTALCARNTLTSEEFELLEQSSKEYLENPFNLIYSVTNKYLKDTGTKQSDHALENLLVAHFPSTNALQAPNLYQYTMKVDEDPNQLFEELSESVPGLYRKSIWHKIPVIQNL
jgi:hypothetical protein